MKRDSAENGLGFGGGASGAPNSGGAGANPREPSAVDGLLKTIPTHNQTHDKRNFYIFTVLIFT